MRTADEDFLALRSVDVFYDEHQRRMLIILADIEFDAPRSRQVPAQASVLDGEGVPKLL